MFNPFPSSFLQLAVVKRDVLVWSDYWDVSGSVGLQRSQIQLLDRLLCLSVSFRSGGEGAWFQRCKGYVVSCFCVFRFGLERTLLVLVRAEGWSVGGFAVTGGCCLFWLMVVCGTGCWRLVCFSFCSCCSWSETGVVVDFWLFLMWFGF